MYVYVTPTGRRIEPFGDPPGDVLIQNRPLSEWQSAFLAQAGLKRLERYAAPCLVIPDTLFTTAEVLRRFVDRAAGRDAVLVLGASTFGKQSTFVQPGVVEVPEGWRFDAVRFESGRNEPPIPVVVDPEEQTLEVTLPGFVGGGKATISLPRHPVLTVHHWVHILWVNQAAGAAEMRARPKWRFALSVLWAIVRSLSLNKWKVLGKLNRIGKKCDIHPTATVEASTLGDGVSVGPFARVVASMVGDGATIMAGAHVELSTIGPRAVVSQLTALRFCVLYPEAIAGQSLMQQCVLGHRAMTTLGSYSIDLNFDHPIQVPLDGRLHSTGTPFVGSAFGHRCRIGTGLWLNHGRMIPNDYFLVRAPADVLSKLPEGLEGEGPLTNDGGVLRPVRRREPNA